VLLVFSVLMGHDATSDALGIAVGHLFFFAEDVWPALARSRGWRLTRLLPTPSALRELAAALGLGGRGAAARRGAALEIVRDAPVPAPAPAPAAQAPLVA